LSWSLVRNSDRLSFPSPGADRQRCLGQLWLCVCGNSPLYSSLLRPAWTPHSNSLCLLRDVQVIVVSIGASIVMLRSNIGALCSGSRLPGLHSTCNVSSPCRVLRRGSANLASFDVSPLAVRFQKTLLAFPASHVLLSPAPIPLSPRRNVLSGEQGHRRALAVSSFMFVASVFSWLLRFSVLESLSVILLLLRPPCASFAVCVVREDLFSGGSL
jgi:hypothetical protein